MYKLQIISQNVDICQLGYYNLNKLLKNYLKNTYLNIFKNKYLRIHIIYNGVNHMNYYVVLCVSK